MVNPSENVCLSLFIKKSSKVLLVVRLNILSYEINIKYLHTITILSLNVIKTKKEVWPIIMTTNFRNARSKHLSWIIYLNSCQIIILLFYIRLSEPKNNANDISEVEYFNSVHTAVRLTKPDNLKALQAVYSISLWKLSL